jgi:hypothetical protein
MKRSRNTMNKAFMMNNYGRGHESYEKSYNHQPPFGQGGSNARSNYYNSVPNNDEINPNSGFYYKCRSEKHY